jgi:putative transposase
LVRYQDTGNFHFVSFSCYRRQPLLATLSGYGIFERELEQVRQRHSFVVAGYVVMPEHMHLLVGEPGSVQLSVALQVLKQQVSRKLKRPGEIRFWQRRYYDFNVWSHEKTIEKLKYIHRNPVRRAWSRDRRTGPGPASTVTSPESPA